MEAAPAQPAWHCINVVTANWVWTLKGVRHGTFLRSGNAPAAAFGARASDQKELPINPCVCFGDDYRNGDVPMNGIIYLVGLVVVIMAILSFFGMR